MANEHYVIRGGAAGRERLRLLARVMEPTTASLLRRVGVQAGWQCLDVGCGGGDVTFLLTGLVGPVGTVTGTDIDAAKLEIASREARGLGLSNVEFKAIG